MTTPAGPVVELLGTVAGALEGVLRQGRFRETVEAQAEGWRNADWNIRELILPAARRELALAEATAARVRELEKENERYREGLRRIVEHEFLISHGGKTLVQSDREIALAALDHPGKDEG